MPYIVQKDARVDGEIVTVWLRRTSPWATWGARAEALRYDTRRDARKAVEAVKRPTETAVLSIVEEREQSGADGAA
jgi:hypothetical protein